MSASSAPLTALVAGHAASEASVVRDVLSRLGIARIEAVADGQAALAAMASGSPDLLVLDWDIPEAAVDALVGAARKSGDGETKIILTMASPTRSALDEAKALGIDSVVATPFSPRRLMDRIPRLRPAAQGEPAAVSAPKA